MSKAGKPKQADAFVIQTQTKIIATIFGIFIIGLCILFWQNFNHTKNVLLSNYLGIWGQNVAALNNSVDQVVMHVDMMKSVVDTHLVTGNSSFSPEDFNKVAEYHPEKKYYIYRYGEVVDHKEVMATIIGSHDFKNGTMGDANFAHMAMDLQLLQKAHQKNHPNFVLSYFSSLKRYQAEFYPRIPIDTLLQDYESLGAWMDESYQIFADGDMPVNNPERTIFWTDPYIDPVGNGKMVSCAIPVYDHDVHIGFLGSDVVLDFLKEHTMETLVLPGIRAIVAENGMVLSATGLDYTTEGGFKTLADILPEDISFMGSGTPQISFYENKGYFLSVVSLTNAPWRYVFAFKKDLVYVDVFRKLQWFAFVILLIIFIIPLSFLFIFKKIIKPGIQAEKDLKQLNRQLDLKVNERTKALKAREVYSKTLFEDSRMPLIVMDAETYQYTDCNNAAVEIYQYRDKAEVMSKTPMDVSAPVQYDGTDSATLAKKYISEALEKGVTIFEWKHQRPSGEFWDAEVQLMSIESENDTFLQFAILDITARKQAEAEKRKLESQLFQSRKMDAIGQLAGGVAHDFNNMLSGIMGAAELLKYTNKDLDTKSRQYVDMIFNTAMRAADLTAKLLAFGRKGDLELQNIDIHSVIGDTLAILSKTIHKSIVISNQYLANQSTVFGDSTGLQNVFINIGLNASHAMPGGGKLSFTTKNIQLDQMYCESSPFDLQAGQFIEVEIHDTGCGIEPEEIKKIFEPFYTTRGHGEGTGLGLAAVYGIVQKHHGGIDVYSEVGIGTVFRLYLPNTVGGEKYLSSPRKGEITKGAGTILLVDDEEIVRTVGMQILEHSGYNVITAKDGLEALEIFKNRHDDIDLVVTDMIMPKMDGKELFGELLKVDKDCKVILASGFTQGEDLQALREVGLSGFISKPFSNVEISHLVAKVLKS